MKSVISEMVHTLSDPDSKVSNCSSTLGWTLTTISSAASWAGNLADSAVAWMKDPLCLRQYKGRLFNCQLCQAPP